MSNRLALLGGEKTITSGFTRYNSIGAEELAAVSGVVEGGVLSKFLGTWHPDFYGGPHIQAFEHQWAEYFSVDHAVSVNSNTSGLIAALGAIRLEPGDEVIVSPWTMCASATSILVWNAIPVFADIEPDTFNLSPDSIEARITERTRAVVVTDIFGHAAELDGIMALARRHDLKVIEDAAQAPGALHHGQYAGTVADVGVFSLNYHKHIHTGEGGVCVTRDAEIAERIQMIRNHAEAVAEGKQTSDLANLIGFNFRLGEIEAAIGQEQLLKLKDRVARVIAIAERITAGIDGLAGLRMPVVRPGCTHVYYVYPLVYDPAESGVTRDRVVEALRAEGVSCSNGYQNIHMLPMFQQQIAYGHGHFPWSLNPDNPVDYGKGICPVAEDLHDRTFIALSMCLFEFTDSDVELIIKAFHKVWDNLSVL